jgi:hypothetical protein
MRCCVEDGGGPSGVALRGVISNRPHAALAEDFVNMNVDVRHVRLGRRCCTRRWRKSLDLRSRLAGGGFKPPTGALAHGPGKVPDAGQGWIRRSWRGRMKSRPVWRSAAAMLVFPARRRVLMARFLKLAMTRGPL